MNILYLCSLWIWHFNWKRLEIVPHHSKLYSTAVHIAIYLSFSWRNKHALPCSLGVRACVRFTNSKENWPIHNTFRSHLLVYFGEFLHTIDATNVLKMMMWLFENWNFRALSLSLICMLLSRWALFLFAIYVYLENRLVFLAVYMQRLATNITEPFRNSVGLGIRWKWFPYEMPTTRNQTKRPLSTTSLSMLLQWYVAQVIL